MGYVPQKLGVEESRVVDLPSQDTEDTKLFEDYDASGNISAEMTQSLNEEVYAIGGDGNPIHYDPDFAAAYVDATGFFDRYPEGTTVIQGAAFLYEAIRQAEQPVDSVESEFKNPVYSSDMVDMVRVTDDDELRTVLSGEDAADVDEVVTVYGAEAEVVSVHKLTYDESSVDAYTPKEVQDINVTHAAKVPQIVGADDQTNNLLLGLNAEFGSGYQRDRITHTERSTKEKDAFNIVFDEYAYTDGTKATMTLLEPHDETRQTVTAAYEERAPDDLVAAYIDLMRANQEFLETVWMAPIRAATGSWDRQTPVDAD